MKYRDAGAGDEIITAFIDRRESNKSPEMIKRLEALLSSESDPGNR